MGKFLKNFGLGLVYIALSPILLAILALAAVYGLGVCIYEFFAGAIRFFQGKEAFPPLWEDVRVAEIKKAQMDAQLQNPAPAPQAQPAGPSTVYVQQNYYQNHNGTAPQANPAPAPTNQPIDTTGYFSNPNPSTPTLDVSSTPAPAINSNPTPESLTQAQQIAQQPTTNPAGYIDISHDGDPKGGHE
jgi:hypothetical protein